MAATNQKVLESMPVEPALLETANWWFNFSWYGLLVSGLIAAFAASATVAFLFAQFWSSGIRERQTEWRTSVLELQTAEAKKETAEAQERIAQLNNETARLRDTALASVQAGRSNALAVESNRSVTEVLAVAQGWVKRETTSESTRAVYIIEKVAPFAGKKFDVVVTSIAINLGAFAASLRSALKMANWIEIERPDPTAGVGILQMDRSGGPVLVTIDVDAGKDPELLDAAKTLALALDEEGIAATVTPKAETDAANVNVIHILVGPKS